MKCICKYWSDEEISKFPILYEKNWIDSAGIRRTLMEKGYPYKKVGKKFALLTFVPDTFWELVNDYQDSLNFINQFITTLQKNYEFELFSFLISQDKKIYLLIDRYSTYDSTHITCKYSGLTLIEIIKNCMKSDLNIYYDIILEKLKNKYFINFSQIQFKSLVIKTSKQILEEYNWQQLYSLPNKHQLFLKDWVNDSDTSLRSMLFFTFEKPKIQDIFDCEIKDIYLFYEGFNYLPYSSFKRFNDDFEKLELLFFNYNIIDLEYSNSGNYFDSQGEYRKDFFLHTRQLESEFIRSIYEISEMLLKNANQSISCYL